MKKLIKASRGYVPNYDEILQADKRCLVGVQNKMQDLFDILDSAPEGFGYRYGLTDLYDELEIAIREADSQLTDWHLQ